MGGEYGTYVTYRGEEKNIDFARENVDDLGLERNAILNCVLKK
jgi:hypothetical protein